MATNLKFPFFQLHFSSGHFLYPLISAVYRSDVYCEVKGKSIIDFKKFMVWIYKENNQPFPSLLFESKKNLILTICYALVSSVIPLPIIIFFATAQKL